MNIVSYHLGHGLIVCDKDTIDPSTRDYTLLTFIDPDRRVTFCKKLINVHQRTIIGIARDDDRSVSISQPETKVFTNIPDPDLIIKTKNKFR